MNVIDPRILEHAKILVDYSTEVKRGDNVLIQITDYAKDLASEIHRQTSMLGANPLICYDGHPWDAMPTELIREYYESTPREYLETFPAHRYDLVKASDVIIVIRSEENPSSLTSIDPKKISLRARVLKKIMDEWRKKRWCITQHPTPGYAQKAEMSLREYEDFVYSAMLMDREKTTERMRRLQKIMNNTDEVRIIGDKTDITMSIRGRKAVMDDAHHNLPGGEIFTAPLDGSANGEIFFDVPAVRFGRDAADIKLKLRDGEIIDYSAGRNQDLLEAMIRTDEGSKRFGELGIGMNMQITRFTRNILFDEKMGGTIHLAIGNAFKDCGGTNESAIHWDLIKTMKTGKIIMDGDVIQENGKFEWE